MTPEQWAELNVRQKAANPKLGAKQLMLSTVVHLAAWATPNTLDYMKSVNWEARKKKGGCVNLKDQVTLVGWGTPTAYVTNRTPEQQAAKSKELVRSGTSPLGSTLAIEAQLAASGSTPSGSGAATKRIGRLNPDFSLWLMGYPTEWASCAAQATPSCRKRRKRTSART
jgi:hypothetical protein